MMDALTSGGFCTIQVFISHAGMLGQHRSAFFLDKTAQLLVIRKLGSHKKESRRISKDPDAALTSLGEVTMQTQATARKPGDRPTGGAGIAGLRRCLMWLFPERKRGDTTLYGAKAHTRRI